MDHDASPPTKTPKPPLWKILILLAFGAITLGVTVSFLSFISRLG